MADLIGQSLGRYTVQDYIGRGGMATVYRGYDPVMERDVAIKVLAEILATEESYLVRFEREARIVANLRHSHILPVFDYGHQENIFYLVMPYIEAGTLEHYIENNQLSLADITRLVYQMASALDYAHKQGIIHRDMKPGNVLLDQSKNALVADFGLARLTSNPSGWTNPERILGTPWYMSPEQAKGAEMDGRSDIYTLGVILYELIVGELPFTADTVTGVVYQHVHEPHIPAVSKLPNLPLAVSRVIDKALEKLPQKRYQTAAEMAEAIVAAQQGVTSYDPLMDRLFGNEFEATERPTSEVAPAPKKPGIYLTPPPPDQEIIGRDVVLKDLKKQLLAQKTLALHGLPGVGKTTLALALAYDPDVKAAFPDGVLWVSLGTDAAPLQQLGIWGKALGIGADELAGLATTQERKAILRFILEDKKMLLVIDDAWTIDDALSFKLGGSGCGYILTSRLPEACYDFAESSMFKVQELSVTDGMVLLEKLAPDVIKDEPDLALTLVKSVGALPLALSLFGKHINKKARTGQAGRLIRELRKLERAEERLKVSAPALSHESQTMHGGMIGTISLAAVISVSDDALPGEARNALHHLSVFPAKPSSFSEDAALFVSDAEFDALDLLVDYGMMEVQTVPDGTSRYTVHQTIIDYTRSKLTETSPYARLVRYYTDTFTAMDGKFDYEAMVLERENVTAALDISGGASEMHGDFIALTNALYRYWEMYGLYDTAVTYLQAAEQIAEAGQNHLGRAECLLNLGRIAEKRGDLDLARTHLEAGLALIVRQNTPQHLRVIVHLLTALGLVKAYTDEFEGAQTDWQTALQYANHLGDKERISTIRMNLALLMSAMDDVEGAIASLQESLKVAREIDDHDLISHVLQNLGSTEANREHYDEALAYFDESLQYAQKTRSLERMSEIYLNLGELERIRQQYDDAEEYLREGLDVAVELGNPSIMAHMLANLGSLFSERGYLGQAQEYLEEALTIARKRAKERYLTNALSSITYIMQTLSEIYLKQDKLDEAFKMYKDMLALGQAQDIPELNAECLFNLARLAHHDGEMQMAQEFAQDSISFFTQIGQQERIEEVEAWLKTVG